MSPLSLVLCLACLGQRTPAEVEEQDRPRPEAPVPGRVQLLASSVAAPVGSRVAVAVVGTSASGDSLAAVEGWLSWDPAVLRFVGVPADSLPVVAAAAAAAAQGRLRVVAVHPVALRAAAQLVFERRVADADARLAFVPERALTARLVEVAAPVSRDASARAPLAVPASLHDAPAAATGAALLAPPTTFGDVNGSGALTIGDALQVSQWVNGTGTPDSLQRLAANSFPFNAPGAGGEPDEDPPGWDAACATGLTVADALVISQQVSGAGHPVLGEPLPEADLRPVRCGGVGMLAPDTVPAWIFADSNRAPVPGVNSVFLRRIALIGFLEGTTRQQKAAAIDLIGGTLIGGYRFGRGGGTYVVRFSDDQQNSRMLRVLDSLKALPQVELAIFDFSVSTDHLSPADGAAWSDWSLDWRGRSGGNWGMEAISMPLAWGCSSVPTDGLLAVVDDGFAAPVSGTLLDDLGAAVSSMSGAFGDPSGRFHGTSVAALIAATAGNRTGITGVAAGSRLALFQTLRSNGADPAFISSLADAVQRAGLQGSRAVNASLGLAGVSDTTVPFLGVVTQQYAVALKRTLDVLADSTRDVLLVLPAGNNGPMGARWGGPPSVKLLGHSDRVVVVASIDSAFRLAASSQRGTDLVDLAAPGQDIETLDGSGNTRRLSGTSFAAPLVTGVAGLLLGQDPTLTAAELKRYLVEGARRRGQFAEGLPILDAYHSLKLLAAERPGTPLCGNRVWMQATEGWGGFAPVRQRLTAAARRGAGLRGGPFRR